MEIVVILIVALVVLGPKRLPETAKSLGKGMREFKSSLTGDDRETEAVPAAVPAPPRS